MKNLTIETGYYDNSTFLFLTYSTYMFFSNILHILCDLNFNNTMNCISHNDPLTDCVLKNSAVF